MGQVGCPSRVGLLWLLLSTSACITPRDTLRGDEGMLVLGVEGASKPDEPAKVVATVDRRDLRGQEANGVPQHWPLEPGSHILEVEVWGESWELTGHAKRQSMCLDTRPMDVCPYRESYEQGLENTTDWYCERTVRLTVATGARYEIRIVAGPGRCELRCDPSVSADCLQY